MPRIDLFICNRCSAKESDVTKLADWKMGVLVSCATPKVGLSSPQTVWCPACIKIATTPAKAS